MARFRKYCIVCGKEIVVAKSNARYCQDNQLCKNAYNNARRLNKPLPEDLSMDNFIERLSDEDLETFQNVSMVEETFDESEELKHPERQIIDLLAYFYTRDEAIFAHLNANQQAFMEFQKIHLEEMKEAIAQLGSANANLVQAFLEGIRLLVVNQQSQQVQVNVLGTVPQEQFTPRPRSEIEEFKADQLQITTATKSADEHPDWNAHISMAKLLGKYDHLPPEMIQYGQKVGMLPDSLPGGLKKMDVPQLEPPSEDEFNDLEI